MRPLLLSLLFLSSHACSFREVSKDYLKNTAWILQDLDFPLIVKNGFTELAARGSAEEFLRNVGKESMALTENVEFQSRTGEKPEKIRMKMSDWADTLKKNGTIRYLFSFLHDVDHWHLDKRLLESYPIPAYLRKFSQARILVMGSESRGIALHRHKMSWLGLLAGQKDWFVLPPKAAIDDLRFKFQSPEDLKKTAGVEHCSQAAGDVVVVPNQWWHATFDEGNWTVGFGGQTLSDDHASSLGWAVSAGNLSLLRRKKFKATTGLLELAAGSGHNEVVELLLKRFAPLGSALHHAAFRGHSAVTENLLRFDSRRHFMAAAASRAVSAGRASCLEILLRSGVDVNSRNPQGFLSMASRFGHTEAVQVLVQAGADLKALSKDKQTALHEAANHGHSKVVELLLDLGAEATAADKLGRKAFDLAADKGHRRIMDVLKALRDGAKHAEL